MVKCSILYYIVVVDSIYSIIGYIIRKMYSILYYIVKVYSIVWYSVVKYVIQGGH